MRYIAYIYVPPTRCAPENPFVAYVVSQERKKKRNQKEKRRDGHPFSADVKKARRSLYIYSREFQGRRGREGRGGGNSSKYEGILYKLYSISRVYTCHTGRGTIR